MILLNIIISFFKKFGGPGPPSPSPYAGLVSLVHDDLALGSLCQQRNS